MTHIQWVIEDRSTFIAPTNTIRVKGMQKNGNTCKDLQAANQRCLAWLDCGVANLVFVLECTILCGLYSLSMCFW